MRGPLLRSVVAAGGLLVIACTKDRSPLPTQPPSAEVTTAAGCTADQINGQMSALFPTGDGLADARQLFRTIQKQKPSDITSAQSTTLQLIDYTLKKYYRGKLLDPGGPGVDPTTQVAVVQLIDALLCFVGLDPSGLTLGPIGSPVTTATIGSSGGDLVGSDRLSALRVPSGAVSSDHLFLITRRNELARANACLNTTQRQIPLCYDYSVVPATRFNVNVTLVICQLEEFMNDPSRPRWRLAHQNPDVPGTIQILPRLSDPFGLVCTNAALASTGGLDGLIRGFGSFAARLISPKPLYALHGGLGGSTCCFSDFTAVDPEFTDGFETPSGWTGTGFWNRSTLRHQDGIRIVNTAWPRFVSGASGDETPDTLPTPFTGSFAFWYGEEASGNYLGTQIQNDAPLSGGTSTAPNSGVLTSPLIAMPPDEGQTVMLGFDTWFEIESVDANAFDMMDVSIQDVGTGAVTDLGVLNPAADPCPGLPAENGCPPIPFTSSGFNAAPSWITFTHDLSAFRGKTVRLLFSFDTGDVRYNGFRGWVLDNVHITQPAFGTTSPLQASVQGAPRSGSLIARPAPGRRP